MQLVQDWQQIGPLFNDRAPRYTRPAVKSGLAVLLVGLGTNPRTQSSSQIFGVEAANPRTLFKPFRREMYRMVRQCFIESVDRPFALDIVDVVVLANQLAFLFFEIVLVSAQPLQNFCKMSGRARRA